MNIARFAVRLAVCLPLLASPFASAMEPGACVALDAVPAAVLDAPFLVFGEVHGTREVPAFVASYLCSAVKAGRKITLALELPASEQAAIDVFLASAGTRDDVARLTAGSLWQGAYQDGRTSAAMLGMLDSVRALRAGGADIALLAIDGKAPPAQRDALMADRLRAAAGAARGRQLLALIGGLHAVRTEGKRFNPQYESAVYQLADLRPLALTVGTAGGSAWVCRSRDPATCGAAPWDINRLDAPAGGPFSLAPPSPQFDGVFHVGATSASPPAVRTPKE